MNAKKEVLLDIDENFEICSDYPLDNTMQDIYKLYEYLYDCIDNEKIIDIAKVFADIQIIKLYNLENDNSIKFENDYMGIDIETISSLFAYNEKLDIDELINQFTTINENKIINKRYDAIYACNIYYIARDEKTATHLHTQIQQLVFDTYKGKLKQYGITNTAYLHCLVFDIDFSDYCTQDMCQLQTILTVQLKTVNQSITTIRIDA